MTKIKIDGSNAKFENFVSTRCKRTNDSLDKYLLVLVRGAPKRLGTAMQYVALGGGKRLRPLLVYAVGKAYGANLKALDAPALAIEMIHAFSLVHDDLPAMDDDDLRRGKPTCHVAFDESTAILVGDSLAICAFQIISEAKSLSAEKKILMSGILAKASGLIGMAGGQYLDLHEFGKKTNIKDLEHMYSLKTGALINAAIKLGAVAAGVNDKKTLNLLDKFGSYIGLAFQIKDDILNIEGNIKRLGKNVGTDSARNKVTYPVLVGVSKAKEKIGRLSGQAEKILHQLKIKDSILSELTEYIIQRDC